MIRWINPTVVHRIQFHTNISPCLPNSSVALVQCTNLQSNPSSTPLKYTYTIVFHEYRWRRSLATLPLKSLSIRCLELVNAFASSRAWYVFAMDKIFRRFLNFYMKLLLRCCTALPGFLDGTLCYLMRRWKCLQGTTMFALPWTALAPTTLELAVSSQPPWPASYCQPLRLESLVDDWFSSFWGGTI